MLGLLLYFVHTAWAGLMRARALTLMSTCTLAAALFVMGAYAASVHHGRNLLRAWGEGGHISCAIAEALTPERWPEVQRAVMALPGVHEVRLVPPEQALMDYCARGPEACAALEGVDAKLLPAALHITPKVSMVHERGVERLAQAVAAVPHVEDVAYGAQRLEDVRKVMRTCAYLALGLMALLALAMVFMVSTTIRLMIHARQDEVRILRLVGATKAFVRAPFLIEGLTWGLCAGALAALSLRAVDGLLAGPLRQAQQLLGHRTPLTLCSWQLSAAQLALGAALALLGTWAALHRYLDEDVG